MITFEEWEDLDVVTADYSPSQYEQRLRSSISELTPDTHPEIWTTAIHAKSNTGNSPGVFI